MAKQKTGKQEAESFLLQRIGRQLSRIANERDMTIGELAEATGLSYAFTRDLTDGKRNISILTLEDMAKRLEIPLEELLIATFRREPEAEALKTRWGLRRARKKPAVKAKLAKKPGRNTKAR